MKNNYLLVSAPGLQLMSNGFDGPCSSLSGVLGLAVAATSVMTSLLVLFPLGVLVLAATSSVMTSFYFLALFLLGFGGAGGGASELYTISLQVF